MTQETKLCRRCDKPVVKNYEDYGLFECMHWLCFHLEYEHGDFDPDSPCSDPDCPWWQIEVYRDAVKSLGADPGEIMTQAIHNRYRPSPDKSRE